MGYIHGIGQGPILGIAHGWTLQIIDIQHPIRKVDDLPIGTELCVRRTDLSHSGHTGAIDDHIQQDTLHRHELPECGG